MSMSFKTPLARVLEGHHQACVYHWSERTLRSSRCRTPLLQHAQGRQRLELSSVIPHMLKVVRVGSMDFLQGWPLHSKLRVMRQLVTRDNLRLRLPMCPEQQ